MAGIMIESIFIISVGGWKMVGKWLETYRKYHFYNFRWWLENGWKWLEEWSENDLEKSLL